MPLRLSEPEGQWVGNRSGEIYVGNAVARSEIQCDRTQKNINAIIAARGNVTSNGAVQIAQRGVEYAIKHGILLGFTNRDEVGQADIAGQAVGAAIVAGEGWDLRQPVRPQQQLPVMIY